MSTTITLDDIRAGVADAHDAWPLLQRRLSEGGRAAAAEIYDALKSWVWRAIRGNRPRDELIAWQRQCRRVSVRLGETEPALAARIAALSEMLFISVHFAETNPAEEVLRRKHVGEILTLLRATNTGVLRRDELVDALQIGQSNLTRVLDLMERAGLVLRERAGGECRVMLPAEERTRMRGSGRDEARRLEEERLATQRIAAVLRARAADIAAASVGPAAAALDGREPPLLQPAVQATLLSSSVSLRLKQRVLRRTLLPSGPLEVRQTSRSPQPEPDPDFASGMEREYPPGKSFFVGRTPMMANAGGGR
ncbi:MAG: helix-turn-helix transcriptional regulator [Salinarimonas sp.]